VADGGNVDASKTIEFSLIRIGEKEKIGLKIGKSSSLNPPSTKHNVGVMPG